MAIVVVVANVMAMVAVDLVVVVVESNREIETKAILAQAFY